MNKDLRISIGTDFWDKMTNMGYRKIEIVLKEKMTSIF